LPPEARKALDWCKRHKKLCIALGIVGVVVIGGVVYFVSVNGGVYMIVNKGMRLAAKRRIVYVGRTCDFATRKTAHLWMGRFNPAKHWFVRIPIPPRFSTTAAWLEEWLIRLLKPEGNTIYVKRVFVWILRR
jgi:hypothetical protein